VSPPKPVWGDSFAARDAVAAHLEILHASGQELHVNSPLSTRNRYGDSLARMRLWKQILDEMTASEVPRDGRAMLVTAGSPGAGKSRALHTLGVDDNEYRRIDPDEIKKVLLTHEVEAGTYSDLLRRQLPDARLLMPFELASLVHQESVEVAAQLRRLAMMRGENVILEGTLRWHGQPAVHLDELNRHGYDRLDVLLVDVDSATAQRQAKDRWWQGRLDPASPFGGRFTPRAAIASCYEPDGRSRCRLNAEDLIRMARRQPEIDARLITPETTSDVTRIRDWGSA
jgi:hypothetical protein